MYGCMTVNTRLGPFGLLSRRKQLLSWQLHGTHNVTKSTPFPAKETASPLKTCTTILEGQEEGAYCIRENMAFSNLRQQQRMRRDFHTHDFMSASTQIPQRFTFSCTMFDLYCFPYSSIQLNKCFLKKEFTKKTAVPWQFDVASQKQLDNKQATQLPILAN